MDTFDKVYYDPADLTKFQIFGITEAAGGGYRQYDTDSPFLIGFTGTFGTRSSSNLIEISAGVPILSLNGFREAKLAEISNKYSTEEAKGYFDATENITIGWNDMDRSMYNQLVTMLNLNNAPDDYPVGFSDLNNVEVQITVANFKALMIRYGMAYMTLWGTLGTLRSMATQATTIQELQNIIWS